MKRYYPARSSLTLIKLLLFIPFVIILALLRYYVTSNAIVMWTSMLLCSFLYVFGALIWLPLYFKKTIYNISRKEIAKTSGVWFQKHQLMKVSSVQYLTRIYSPLSKFTGLNFVRFNALGGTITLVFLSKEDTEEIITLISSEIRLKENN